MGAPGVFAFYASALAVTMVAAIFSREIMLRIAITVIVASWFITKFWRMSELNPGLGYTILDVALTCIFYLIWKNPRKTIRTLRNGVRYVHAPPNHVIARDLFIIHCFFLALHPFAEIVDLSGNYLGYQGSHEYGYAFWRNRIFDASLLYVIYVSTRRILIIHVPAIRERAWRKAEERYANKGNPKPKNNRTEPDLVEN